VRSPQRRSVSCSAMCAASRKWTMMCRICRRKTLLSRSRCDDISFARHTFTRYFTAVMRSAAGSLRVAGKYPLGDCRRERGVRNASRSLFMRVWPLSNIRSARKRHSILALAVAAPGFWLRGGTPRVARILWFFFIPCHTLTWREYTRVVR